MSDCLILYLLDHKAYIAGAESSEIPDPDDEWSIQIHIQLACHRPTTLCCTARELLKLLCNIWNQEVKRSYV